MLEKSYRFNSSTLIAELYVCHVENYRAAI